MSNVEIVKGLYQSFASGDIPAVLAGMTADIEWREAEGNPYKMDGEPFIGPQSILQDLFAKLAEDWEAFTVTPKAFHDAGETVVVEARYTGVNKATGLKQDAQACHIWKLENGKARSFQQYTDTAQLQRLMGQS